MANGKDPRAEELVRKLRKGKLPQMVDWFDPLVLGVVAVRTLISTTIGEYADQRPMQEAADGEENDEKLVTRHDFSKPAGANLLYPPDADPNNLNHSQRHAEGEKEKGDSALNAARANRRLKLCADALWVDFIADLGDGFEATYAMASLLAADRLEIKHADKPLPAGQILIFGGDLAYPNATIEEYRRRCLDPYDWAFTADRKKPEPDRELFFIAGNHDWYDGLSAFTTQFCYEASSVGGWRCRQERSYFALRLPYDWWIWGIDVALGDKIDVGQLHYFQKIVARIKEKENAKILIILHAPDWTKPAYNALTSICQLAREKGEVCAIIAGDLHHYSRYQSIDKDDRLATAAPLRGAPLQLITSGGGGAFAHPTHDRTSTLAIEPAVATRRRRATGIGRKVEKPETEKYLFRAKSFYPSKGLSRLLVLKNLALPFRNTRFALLLGFVYLLYAWVFNVTLARDPLSLAPGAPGGQVADAAAVATAAESSPAFFFMLLGLWLGLISYVDANLTGRATKWLNGPFKVLLGTLHCSAHVTALLYVSALSLMLSTDLLNPLIGMLTLWGKVAFGELAQGLSFTSGRESHLQEMLACLGKLDWGSAASWDCPAVFLKTDAFYIAAKALAYAASSIVVGGLIGALIFGCYWVITSVLFAMHPDAFSALAVKDYKNFLRMKFEQNQLTIYPIALDLVPGRREWRAFDEERYPQDAKLRHRPLLVAKRGMQARLIEDPIIITRPGQPPTEDPAVYEPLG
jgi:hypothetical protein